MALIVAGVVPLRRHNSRDGIHGDAGKEVAGHAIVKIVYANPAAPVHAVVVREANEDADVAAGARWGIAIDQIQPCVAAGGTCSEGHGTHVPGLLRLPTS